jgi:TIGR03009 family protein
MRRFGLTLVCLALATGAASAQPPAAQPVGAGQEALNALLLNWERTMAGVQTIQARVTRITLDKTFQETEVFEGMAKYMKPNLAILEMRKKGKEQVYEKYICTGTFLFEYRPQTREIRAHEMPTPKPGQVAEDNFLSFIFGMRAEEARRRYELRLVKEDQWYFYIEIQPRTPADRADFQRARLVLNRPTFLPRELWFEQPNGNEVKWDIQRLEANAPLNRSEFTAPAVPQGWNLVRVPRSADGASRGDGPPRIIRPNQ